MRTPPFFSWRSSRKGRTLRGAVVVVGARMIFHLFLLLLSTTSTTVVQACGGFWCTLNQPVNQARENIVFAYNQEEHQVTAIIQIMYQGPSENFAWILPVPGVPTVNVSSNVAFENLERATDPSYTLNYKETVGECKSMERNDEVVLTSGAVSDNMSAPVSSVTVEAQGSIGPYDFVVISLDPTLSDPAQVAVDWLDTNGYDLFDETADVIRPYLQRQDEDEDIMNLIAFRLTKGNDDGAIRPVVLTYESDTPMIPIRPTAVAANDNMGIRVWVLAHGRAIPSNYKSLLPNMALINWFNWRDNYEEVITAAANEANGQGFVTELATETEDLNGGDGSSMIFDSEEWNEYITTNFQDGFDAIQQASWRYRNYDGFREAVLKAVTLPPGLSADEFGSNPFAYQDRVQVDQDLFKTCLKEDVIDPLIATQKIFDSYPYMTRLYTTMSAEEMTEDPIFTINLDLPDVSNIHTADITIFCNKNVYEWEAPWEIELPNNAGVLTGNGSFGVQPWPYAIDDMPANDMIWALSDQGSGDIVLDNTAEIGRFLEGRKNQTVRDSSSCVIFPDRIHFLALFGCSSMLFVWWLTL